MSKRILSVSYDVSLLATRGMLLEQRGYSVTSALGFTQALAECRTASFDLFILGHSIPEPDKLELIKTFRKTALRLFSPLSALVRTAYLAISTRHQTNRKN